ncbi:hypothetical protein BSKO_12544 [Bryopsis sp. KO-2023]|nr:hypothetical protein BSKO_12544 [Bryopsis sp. KO-2023]
MSSLHRCLHEIQVAPVEGGEEEGNESETTDRFRAVSKGFAKGWGSCNLGEFNFEPVSGTDNKMIMDVVLLRENGEVKETFTVIQVRVDDAEMAKQADEEEVGAAESPASRLREKIKCRQEGD